MQGPAACNATLAMCAEAEATEELIELRPGPAPEKA